MTTGIAFKNSKKAYPPEINFTIHWLIVQLMIKIMNMFLKAVKMLNC